MNRNKRRHKTGFSYIGAGNNTSVFNRKPRRVFSETKNKLNTESQNDFHLKFNDKGLSKTDRAIIKNKIRSESRRKTRLTLFLSILILIPIVIVIIGLIESVLAKYK